MVNMFCLNKGWTFSELGDLLFSHSVMSNFCNSMNCSMPSFPVLHYLPESAQTHVHWVSDSIQPSQPVAPFSSCLQSFPASRSFPMSQLFASGGQSIGASASATVLPWIFRVDSLRNDEYGGARKSELDSLSDHLEKSHLPLRNPHLGLRWVRS